MKKETREKACWAFLNQKKKNTTRPPSNPRGRPPQNRNLGDAREPPPRGAFRSLLGARAPVVPERSGDLLLKGGGQLRASERGFEKQFRVSPSRRPRE